ncbi:serine hydrolase domain-containing protein [Acidobacteriota bacterium]
MLKLSRHAQIYPKIILLLLFSVFITADCRDNTAKENSVIAGEIDALFADFNENTPGCAVMVIRNGKIVHQTGYGMADIERKVKMGSDIAIRLASVSKQFTAMGIMILAEQGKLGFDDPAVQYIPELAGRYGDKITVRHLLTHTSGLPDYYDAMTQFPSERMPVTEDGAAVFAKWGKSRFEPGEKFEYSNPGYEMLALIIEKASGQTFPEFLKSEIFTPLGMTDSLVMTHPETHFPKRSYGYRLKDDGYVLLDDHRFNLMLGAGGVYTTLEDMYLWDQALYTEELIKKATLDLAFTPMKLLSGKDTDYGFGWTIENYKGLRRLSHGGGWVGFRTGIARYPDRKLTVVVLSNSASTNPRTFIEKISDLFLDISED